MIEKRGAFDRVRPADTAHVRLILGGAVQAIIGLVLGLVGLIALIWLIKTGGGLRARARVPGRRPRGLEHGA